MEDVLPLRGEQTPRIDPATLPDPRPVVAAELRDLIDRCAMPWPELAAALNQVCGVTNVDRWLIELWYSGGAFPRMHHERVLRWLAGEPIPRAELSLAP